MNRRAAPARRLARALVRAGCLLGLAAAAPVLAGEPGFSPDGSWHLLLHYQDAASARPERWSWEDRVWDFQGEGDQRVFTQFETVSFVDGRGRFTSTAGGGQRVPGAWEPDDGQLREIRRGLFVNPRGAHSLRLAREPGGWRSSHDLEAGVRQGRALSLALEARISTAELPRIELRRVLLLPAEARQDVAHEELVAERAEPGLVRGRYRSGTREGRFSLRASQLRERVRPDVRRSQGELVMKPDRIGDWGNFVPSLLRPFHYFPERRVDIRTTPPGADLDLLYLRRGGSLRLFEQARAPLRVRLPSRFLAGAGDALVIRAFADGYRRGEQTLAVHSKARLVEIALERSARVVRELWVRDVQGRAGLSVFTDGAIDVQRRESGPLLRLVLPDTVLAEGVGATLPEAPGTRLRQVRPLQIGSDLMITVELAAPHSADRARYRSGVDLARRGWRLTVDLADAPAEPPGGGASPDHCRMAFEAALREGLDPSHLARALSVRDPTVGPVVVRAIEALAAGAPDGRLVLLSGSRLDPSRPADRGAANAFAHELVGLLAVLDTQLGAPDGEHARLSLFAPGMPRAPSRAVLADGRARERACRAAARRD